MTTATDQSVPAHRLFVDGLRDISLRIRRTGVRGVACTLGAAAIATVIALVLPLQFRSSASFVAQGPNTSGVPSALLGLAASVGIGAAKDYSPQFYADLLTSDPVLIAAIDRKYATPNDLGGGEQTYLEIEGLANKNPMVAHDVALRRLRRRVSARADVRTNIVSVAVTARYPELSRDLAEALLSALDSMNIGFRQEQSRELRQFFQGRVADAQHELDSAETELRRFLERNRAVENSPLLRFEQLRLTRSADLKRTLYTTVLQQFEEAKMQEARNVPVLTVLTKPSVPIRKSGPPRRFIVALGIILGLVIALVLDEFFPRSSVQAPRS